MVRDGRLCGFAARFGGTRWNRCRSRSIGSHGRRRGAGEFCELLCAFRQAMYPKPPIITAKTMPIYIRRRWFGLAQSSSELFALGRKLRNSDSSSGFEIENSNRPPADIFAPFFVLDLAALDSRNPLLGFPPRPSPSRVAIGFERGSTHATEPVRRRVFPAASVATHETTFAKLIVQWYIQIRRNVPGALQKELV